MYFSLYRFESFVQGDNFCLDTSPCDRPPILCRQLLIGHLTFFTLVQKVKSCYTKFMLHKQTKALPKFCKLFHLKMTCTSCTLEVSVMVPSFQKVTYFLQDKILHRDVICLHFCLFEDVTDSPDLKR